MWLKGALVYLSVFIGFGLAQANTIDAISTPPDIGQIKISPNGDYLCLRVLRDGRYSLLFLDRRTTEPVGHFKLSGKREIGKYYWANDERVVFEVLKTPNNSEQLLFYGELGAVNIDGSSPDLLFGYDAHVLKTGTHFEKKKRDYAWGEVLDPLPQDWNHVLISSTPYSFSLNKRVSAQLLDVYTGVDEHRQKISKYPSASFLPDPSGNVRLVKSLLRDRSVVMQSLPSLDKDWINVPADRFSEDLQMVSMSGDGRHAYVLDYLEKDKLSLYRLSLDGSGYEVVYSHKDVDVTSPAQSVDHKPVYALRVDSGYPGYVLLSDGREAQIFKQLLKLFGKVEVNVTSKSVDGTFWTVLVNRDTDPGTFYLFDSSKSEIEFLSNSYFNIDSGNLASMEPIEYFSFDGTKISGYFTKAITSDEVAPLVILLHEGPRARDYWGFNAEVQALALNGYSVLQVNYRGSSGYGKEFMNAGNRHWGDHIPQDIITGAKWSVETGLARSDDICVMGTGFGGYAAVQSAISEPGLFRCVVANSGFYDLNLLYDKGVIDLYGGRSYLNEVIGVDSDELRKFSPVDNVERLDAPMLLAYGKQAYQAPMHAKRMIKALKKNDKEFRRFVRKGEGHGFHKAENKTDYLKTVIEFLDQTSR